MNELERLKWLKVNLTWSGWDKEDSKVIKRLIDAEIARQQTTSEDVQKAIDWFSDRSSVAAYMNGEVQPNFRKVHQDVLHAIDAALQQYAPKTEATQKAIEWQQSLKQHHQREWEKTDVEWKMEPGAQEHHEAMMTSFDLAIGCLEWAKARSEK